MTSFPYFPQDNYFGGLERLLPDECAPWDDYFIRMAETYYNLGTSEQPATKTYFFRSAPFKGSYAVFAGLHAFIRAIDNFRWSNPGTMAALRDMGCSLDFINFLDVRFKLDVKIHAVQEGSVVFPHEPVVVISGPLLDVTVVEGILLSIVNFATLLVTKWHRVKLACNGRPLLEFGRRRAQNPLVNSLYAYIGGADASSNREIRRAFNIPCSGTMGHEYIQQRGDELQAFREWLQYNPDRPVLLIDTIDTKTSGIENAITAFKEFMPAILAAGGKPAVRLDSGHLGPLAAFCRKKLDAAGLTNVNIILTNDLDEEEIRLILGAMPVYEKEEGLEAGRCTETLILACGTKPSTCADQPSLGGVAKLTSIERDGVLYACMKLAKDNPSKASIPAETRSCGIHDENGKLGKVVIHLADECAIEMNAGYLHPSVFPKAQSVFEKIRFTQQTIGCVPRQKLVYDARDGGIKMTAERTIHEVRERVFERVGELPDNYVGQFGGLDKFPVYLSERIHELRNRMTAEGALHMEMK